MMDERDRTIRDLTEELAVEQLQARARNEVNASLKGEVAAETQPRTGYGGRYQPSDGKRLRRRFVRCGRRRPAGATRSYHNGFRLRRWFSRRGGRA